MKDKAEKMEQEQNEDLNLENDGKEKEEEPKRLKQLDTESAAEESSETAEEQADEDKLQDEEKNINWHDGKIDKAAREKNLGQKGMVIWFTGLSASGKSTIAVEVEKMLFNKGYAVYRLDGDNMRFGLNKDLGFSAADREENIRRIGEVAALFADAGLITLASFISPYQEGRDAARKAAGKDSFIEVYVRAEVDTCAERDPKGLYAKVKSGEIDNFTGISAPYEEPETPDLI
ncbi:MAG: adenylyl-sulfate kinase, partial [Halanaerobiales bacterium]|nr:adenylyl-sulfate kinase [Halanaerobiales bacterium]